VGSFLTLQLLAKQPGLGTFFGTHYLCLLLIAPHPAYTGQ